MTIFDCYAITIDLEDGIYHVDCRDLPGLITAGDTHAEAIANAADALEVIVGAMIDNDLELTDPSPAREGEISIALPATLAAKAAIYRAWKRSRLTKSELARRMGVADTEAHRVLDSRHATKLERLDAAARVLGFRLVIGLEAAE